MSHQSGSESYQKGLTKGESEVCIDENTLHSGSIWMLPNKRMSPHADIYEGEVRSRNGDTSPIVLKFAENNLQSITEARILAKLKNHSHVLSFIHSGIFNFRFVDQIYIALDKCHHENLCEFVTNRKNQGFAFNLSRAIEIAEQMVAGLKYIHENRIIHKDIKPANILFSLDQRLIKIADFGVSQEIHSTSAEFFEEGQFGTNGFRPPESFGRGFISQKSDIFSFGVTFYFVLSNGEHLFGEDPDGWNYNMKNGIVDLSGLLVSNIKTTEHLIKSMIEHKINDRPTIWQVSEHPFWTRNEVSCDFDYHCPESSVSQIPPTSEEPSHNYADLRLFREHLEKVKLRDEAAAAKAQSKDYHCVESAESLIPPTSEEQSFNIDVDVDPHLEHLKNIQLRDEAAAAKIRERAKDGDADLTTTEAKSAVTFKVIGAGATFHIEGGVGVHAGDKGDVSTVIANITNQGTGDNYVAANSAVAIKVFEAGATFHIEGGVGVHAGDKGGVSTVIANITNQGTGDNFVSGSKKNAGRSVSVEKAIYGRRSTSSSVDP